MARAVVDKIVQEELRCVVQNGPGTALQETLVQVVRIMIPGIERKPCAAHWPDTPLVAIDRLGIAPQIGVVMNHKSSRAIVVLRNFAAGTARGRADHVDQVDERQHRFAKAGGFSEPVVHLGVDVDGPLRSPRIVDAAGPESLQIGGQAAGARGTDQ